MNKQIIKKEVDKIYKKIKVLNDKLEVIRNEICNHPETETCDYMWSPDHILYNSKICKFCGKLITSELYPIKT